jgi:hypothetical protein
MCVRSQSYDFQKERWRYGERRRKERNVGMCITHVWAGNHQRRVCRGIFKHCCETQAAAANLPREAKRRCSRSRPKYVRPSKTMIRFLQKRTADQYKSYCELVADDPSQWSVSHKRSDQQDRSPYQSPSSRKHKRKVSKNWNERDGNRFSPTIHSNISFTRAYPETAMD